MEMYRIVWHRIVSYLVRFQFTLIISDSALQTSRGCFKFIRARLHCCDELNWNGVETTQLNFYNTALTSSIL